MTTTYRSLRDLTKPCRVLDDVVALELLVLK